MTHRADSPLPSGSCDVLQVIAGSHLTGTLSRSQREQDIFYFSYEAGSADPAGAVSLTMPVVRDPYDAMSALHPVFEMNLPEGALRQRLELMFSKLIPGFDDLDLLRIVGRHQLGRLRFSLPQDAAEEMPSQSLSELLAYDGAQNLFEDLLERYARYSGLSGMQPKVLMADAGVSADAAGRDRVTGRSATHIIKSFDERDYPELAANEFVCMQVARLAGLPVANVHLSENARLLAVDRFDLAADGTYLGFEDFCVLSGMRAAGRYTGSYEGLARAIMQFVSPEYCGRALAQLFGMLTVSIGVGNGDAHLKNFGVLYAHYGAPVRLAPAYDIVSTVAYQPRDVMALTLAGRKSFPQVETLMDFAQRHCMMSRTQTVRAIDQTVVALQSGIRLLQEMAGNRPAFKTAAGRLRTVFESGVQQLSCKTV